MRFAAALAVSGALFAAAPAFAGQADHAHTDHVEAAKPAKTAKPAKICRELGARTGTRMSSGKRCKTAEEWAKVDGAAPDGTADARNLNTMSRTNR